MSFCNQRMYFALFISALIHVLVLAVFSSSEKIKEPFLQPWRIELKYVPPTRQVPPGPPQATASKATASKAKLRSTQNKSLATLGHLQGKSVAADAAASGAALPAWVDSESYRFNSMTASAGVTMEEAKFLSRLLALMDRLIYDSGFLSEYGHTGQVFLRFEIDERGQLDARFARRHA